MEYGITKNSYITVWYKYMDLKIKSSPTKTNLLSLLLGFFALLDKQINNHNSLLFPDF